MGFRLTLFAKKSMDISRTRIADDSATGKSLRDRWEEIEAIIIPESIALELVSKDRLVDYKDKVSIELVKCIERLLGALARTITRGGMNKQANQAGTLLHEFLSIRETDLGKKSYELIGYTPV